MENLQLLFVDPCISSDTRMKETIVSLLPVPASRDTRSVKIAMSFARHGYNSILFETRPSSGQWVSPVPLVSLGKRNINTSAPQVESQRPKAERFSTLFECLHFLKFVAMYWVFLPAWAIFKLPKADLYYLHEYRLYPLARIAQLLYGAKIIYDAHDFYPAVWNFNSLSGFWKRCFLPFLTWMDGRAAIGADEVVTVGDGVAECIRDAYRVEPIVVRNCHDQNLEDRNTLSLRQELELDENEVLIVSIGNDKAGHDGAQIVRALSFLPENFHIAFVGRFHEKKSSLAEMLGIRKRVHLPGAVTPEKIVPYVKSADLAILPYTPITENYRYILPNGFFQSIAAGLPLLYTDLPDIMRAIDKHSIGRIIDMSDAKLIAEVIKSTVDAPNELATYRKNVTLLRDILSWQREEKHLIELIRNTIK
ncbi:MAG TPA: hypothetical protein DCX14_08650 [Flavobacteriales bacterium]|nr:hypothetical protein [Flavobacteriales bacterium]